MARPQRLVPQVRDSIASRRCFDHGQVSLLWAAAIPFSLTPFRYSSRSKGFGTVLFANEADAHKAIGLSPVPIVAVLADLFAVRPRNLQRL
jgi:hypothetical protein